MTPHPRYQKPLKFAEWVLKSIHSDHGEYTHLGDFSEVFSHIQADRGAAAAFMWYWFQVIRSLPGFAANRIYWSFAMFKNYLIISFRNTLKNKWFSLLNIAGLAVGMACFILILMFVQFETSFDRFHEKSDRIYRVLSQNNRIQPGVSEFDDNSPELLAEALVAAFPEIKNATRTRKSFTDQAILQYQDKNFYQAGIFADPEFFKIFSFPLLKGGVEQALMVPKSIVLTESVSQKLFGSDNPLGRMIVYKERNRKYDMTVTGVIADVPRNSHLQFDYIISHATTVAEKKDSYMIANWDVWNYTTYVELTSPAAKAQVEGKFPSFLDNQGEKESKIEFFLQPIEDVHLRSQIQGERATNNQVRYVYLFMSIALIILLIACINYMNLVTARSMTRAKEIGIRKVSGANRRQLIKQFIGETLLVTMFALGFSLLMIKFILPAFNLLIGTDLQMSLLSQTSLLLMIGGTVLFVGIASGTYPALVLSALRPVNVLKEFSASGKKGSGLRNALVVFQFGASIILIACTLVVFNQLKYVKKQKLGFDREHVVVIPIREQGTRDKAEAIRNQLLQHPDVLGVSVTGGLPTNIRSNYFGGKFIKENGEIIKPKLCFDYVDYDFLDVFKIELVRGRNFSREFSEDEKAILINEALWTQLGWTEPAGKEIDVFGYNRVIGVVKDFHFASFHSEIEPMALAFGKGGNNIAVRVRPGDVTSRVEMIREVFKNNSRSQPFDFYFLDDAFNNLYQREQRTGEIFGYFSLLAIFIACLGLLGLASFMVERRTKEIGIRKILGAPVPKLVGLLTRDFVRMVVLANLIAWPVAYFAMRKWLESFAYRIDITLGVFLLAAGAALLIAFLTISSQTLRAAMSNPVDTLRYE
jgi:putative ABC transport system permease protein